MVFGDAHEFVDLGTWNAHLIERIWYLVGYDVELELRQRQMAMGFEPLTPRITGRSTAHVERLFSQDQRLFSQARLFRSTTFWLPSIILGSTRFEKLVIRLSL